MTTLIDNAILTAGCLFDDFRDDGMSVADALRACAAQPNMGTDGDYSDADRDLFRRAADAAE